MAYQRLFTSESVTEGHPDKLADQISDAVLDAILTEDHEATATLDAADRLVVVGTEGDWQGRVVLAR